MPESRRLSTRLRERAGALLLSDFFVLYLSLAYVLVLIPFLPTLATPANLSNVLSNMWPLLVVAIGQTFVLTIAGIDLSQGAVAGLCSILVAMLIATSAPAQVLGHTPVWGLVLTEAGGPLGAAPFGTWMAIAIVLAVAALIGFANGVAVAVLRMPAFMVTLVGLIALGAFAIWLTQSNNIRGLPSDFIALGKGTLVSLYFGDQYAPQLPRREVHAFITWPMIVALLVALCAHVALSHTVFGRRIFAIGLNRRTAEISGVPVVRVIIAVFAISAICAAIGGLLYTARLETGRPTLGGGNFLLDVIGATVIGGTSLFGGKAKILWTVWGVLFFVLLGNTLNLMNLSAFHIDMVKGGVILAAAFLDVARQRLRRGRT
ncbi:ABC transporter permease [Plastorhodobacter daqingensis]|uniref:ABC transporter permease n=1 Tax=Plastorhodobacter daqingensis TaxID=1387281 RepID=A0ABW2UFK0_9RHOB